MRSELRDTLPGRIRIVAIDEHQMTLAGLCLLVSQQDGFEVVGGTSIFPDAVALVQSKQPDIIVTSIGSDGIAAVEFLADLLKASENSRILALIDSTDQELHRRAIRHGAAGVLSKRSSPATLVKAVECIHAGEAWLDRSTTASLLRELSPQKRAPKPNPEQTRIASLTDREREVIKLVGAGLKNRQIAERLFISDITVHHHLTSIYSKLEVADRLELLIFAYRNRLAELPG